MPKEVVGAPVAPLRQLGRAATSLGRVPKRRLTYVDQKPFYPRPE